MKYTVTYCALDEVFNGNIFWHSCILLSKLNEAEKMEVVDNWGFYGLPSTIRDTWFSQLKIKVGLDVDFTGNHGMLRHEDLRYLEMGEGLHGVTFELTEEQFELLQKKCRTMAKEQEDAIKEVIEPQGLKGKTAEHTRIYPHEDASIHIYAFEKAKASQEGRDSRLKPFEFRPTLGLLGLDLTQSSTCKSQILCLLSGILTEQQLARITEDGTHPTIPRYSGTLERIFLHSCGPLRTHTKSSGDIVYYRDSNDEGVKLYWTLPPQEIEVLSEETAHILKLSGERCDEIKEAVSRLQRLEWLFINAKLPEKYQPYQKELLQHIRDTFTAFSVITIKKPTVEPKGWLASAYSFFSPSGDEEMMKLNKKLSDAENLLNNLYMAVVDGWEIHEDCLVENKSSLREDGDEVYENPLEALAAYLPTKDKKKLCAILGRTYLEAESLVKHVRT